MSDVFVWQGKPLPKIGDLMNAMSEIYAIEDKEERKRTATTFMEQYRASSEHADANIGYLTGYFGHDQMVAMLELFSTEHPMFGDAEDADQITPEKAFELGKSLGMEGKPNE